LPWMQISRCAFLYHYMGASVFATLGLAHFCDRALAKPQLRGLVIWGLFLVAIGFVWWMPVYLGLPLDQAGYQRRMWFPSWVEGVNAFKPR
jgi:dolichyl-phosphate-mannose-protein mannosyltransferase